MTSYHVYGNSGTGPINYSVPVATVAGLAYTTGPLAAPGDWRFAVRAFDPLTGLEEQNLDAAIKIILDASGRDITNTPAPPVGLRAFARPDGAAKVEWHYPRTRGPKTPLGFHVYSETAGPGVLAGLGSPFLITQGFGGMSYVSTPVATVSYSLGFMNSFQATLTGLTDGVTYFIVVRAFNAAGDEEGNTAVVPVVATASGPAPVGSLSAVASV